MVPGRGQTEQAARAAEPRNVEVQTLETLLKMVVDQSKNLLATLDLEGNFLYVNRAYTKSLGYRVDELLSKNAFDLIHADDLEASRAAFESVIGGETVLDFVVRLLDRDRQPVHLLASGSLIRDASGRPVAVSTIGLDVSDTVRLEEELKADRSTLQEIVETSELLFAGCDLDGRIVSWSRACETVTAVRRAEAIGKSLFELIAPREERDALRAMVNGLLEGRKPREFEGAVPCARGEARRVSWSFSLRKSPGGRVTGFLAIGRDTTESRRAERETMRVRETLENILQSLAEGLFVVTQSGETTYWNRRMEELTGLTWAEVINRRTEDTFGWLFQTGFSEVREDILKGRLHAYESPPRMLETPNGRANLVLRAIPYRSADGQIAGTIVKVQDVTDSLRLQAELVRSESRYKNLVESARDCIHVLDLTGRFVEVNASGLATAGISDPSMVLGKRYDQLVDPDSSNDVLRAIGKARGGEPVEFEYSYTSPDGRRIFWNSTLTPIRDARGHVKQLLGISRDITERKRLSEEVREKNAQLVAALDELERFSTLKDEFLSHVSHELRTPLTSIRSYAEILLNYPDEEPALQREFLTIINEECGRLTNLLNDVLDLSKIEAGEMSWRVEPHAVREFIQPAVEVSRSLAMREEITVEIAVDDGLPMVPVDKDRLEQVVLNLLSNAIKHSPHGGTVRVAAGWNGGAASSGRLCVRVSDDGPGIAPEECAFLFDKYFQTRSGSLRKGGTGLGLAICREIVEALGGEIWVETKAGSGSAFAFSIPVAARGASD